MISTFLYHIAIRLILLYLLEILKNVILETMRFKEHILKPWLGLYNIIWDKKRLNDLWFRTVVPNFCNLEVWLVGGGRGKPNGRLACMRAHAAQLV